MDYYKGADRYQQIMAFAVLAGPTGSNRWTDQWDFSDHDDFRPSPKGKQMNEEKRPAIRMCCFRVSSSDGTNAIKGWLNKRRRKKKNGAEFRNSFFFSFSARNT
ncbi:hypothetical protein CEXT_597901 [Caerostris extrusa]|uniref:Uncharacterized protein n=1 Tax=Caerostris extrusa TaxID=172846 RepID=A0AAV4UBV8_CAEEX|nr:hypothetical protein CEXT_597901 [Caerostris extrusa]